MSSLERWLSASFEADGKRREVLRQGEGPAVLLMHEVPGITPEVAHLGQRLVDAGFHVAMPVLFGEVGRPWSMARGASELARACVNAEFRVWARNGTSPVISWLRALCRLLHAQQGGPGVGAVGMCLTGNFALNLMVDPLLMAPVMSQPSLPLALTPRSRGAIAVSESDLALIRERCARDAGLRVLGLRFTGDPMVPAARFAAFRRALAERFEAIELDPACANPAGPRPAHSVLTNHLVDERGHPTWRALQRVIGFFEERLHCDDGASSAPKS